MMIIYKIVKLKDFYKKYSISADDQNDMMKQINYLLFIAIDDDNDLVGIAENADVLK